MDMMTSSNGTISAFLALCAETLPVPVNSPHKGQWRGALMFSLICAWINDWVNNREAGDRGHYDVHVIELEVFWQLHEHTATIQWRHNGRDSVSNHQPHNCLLNRLFRRRLKKISKLRTTGLCEGNSPVPANFPHKCPVKFRFNDVIMSSSWME